MMFALFVLLLTLFSTPAMGQSCGGNCPSGRCPTCYCGTSKKIQNITEWCAKHTWSQSCCKCVVSHESGGNSHALNHNENGSTDVGLWQINNVNWGQCNDGNAPCDSQSNLNCAKKVYQWGGNTWKLWPSHAVCGC